MSAWGKGGSARSCDALLRRVEENDPSLVDLVILPMKNFGDNDVERLASAISRNTHLKSISASGHSISPESFSLLGSAIASQGKKCNLIESTNGHRENVGICSISIGDRKMGDDGIAALCSSLETTNGSPLQSIDLDFKDASEAGMKAIGRCFAMSPSLQRLNISRNERIGDRGAVALCEAAEGSFHSLMYLNLSDCNIGPRGAQALSDCLLGRQGNTEKEMNQNSGNAIRINLMDLILNSNPLGSGSCRALSSLVSSAFSGGSMLSSLSLADCSLGDDGVTALAEAAMRGRTRGLAMLDLSRNGIGIKGIEKLAEVLNRADESESGIHCLESLRELRLAGNTIESNGIICLTSSLVQRPEEPNLGANSTLSVLDLCETDCGVEGAAAALRCGGLSCLRLFNNRLGSDGFEAITPLLRGGHPSLESLDLGGNAAKEEAVARLLRALLQTNNGSSHLRILEMGGNEVGSTVEAVLEELKVVRPELDVARDRPKVRGQVPS